jgi:hypothetical protein
MVTFYTLYSHYQINRYDGPYKSMHWEKIPLEDRTLYGEGRYEKTDLVKEQLEDLKRQGIPFRIVRARQKDGNEVLYIEK